MPSISRFGRALWVVLLVTAACSKKTGESTPPGPVPSSSVAPSAAAQVSAVPSAAPQASAGTGLATTLADRLAREAQSRPAIQPNADDVLAALARVGGAVVTKKQGLGATYKASFCEGGTTGDGAVTIGVCEYPDESAAKDGLAAIQAVYPAKLATHVLHKDTVLTTLRLQDGPAAQALESKLLAAYKTL